MAGWKGSLDGGGEKNHARQRHVAWKEGRRLAQDWQGLGLAACKRADGNALPAVACGQTGLMREEGAVERC